MEVTTPVGDTRADTNSNTRDDGRVGVVGRHGDVDKNGDLVDLAAALRLRAAITAMTPAGEDDQLRVVVGMLGRRGFVEVSS